jgi:tyrosine-protein kinase Etk/Wzc
MVEAKNNIIMITSGSAEVGKSFVASNFCTVLAQSGQRVLLVDADLRRGYLHKRLSFDVGSGLSGFLQSSLSIADVAKTTKIDGLDLVSRGAVPPNPSELLMSDRFKQFIDEASNAYDLIVIDTPPILAVTDAAVIGQFVGTSMMVARFEKSTVREVEAANERFRLNGIDIKGLIFNAIEAKASSYYGGYSYYNYSYESHSSKD